MSFLVSLKNEYIKTKKTWSFWLVSSGGLLIPALLFFVQYFKWEHFVNRATDPWNFLMLDALNAVSKTLFSFFTVLVVGLNFSIEHKADSWKKLFVLPIRRTELFFAKLSFINLQLMFSLLLFFAATLLVGFFLGLFHPELNYGSTQPQYSQFFKNTIKVYIASLGLIGFQFLVSFYFKNLIVPFFLGIFMIIAGTLLAQWEYAEYNLFSYNVFLNLHLKNLPKGSYTFGLLTYQFFSGFYFLFFSGIAWLLFKKKTL